MNFDEELFNEKQFNREDDTVLTQAACLDRIYRTVDRKGLSSESLRELETDIEYICKCYGVDSNSAVLLAAILEHSISNNHFDDVGLARYLGCTNIEFIKYHDVLRNMEKKGIINVGGSHFKRRYYFVTPELLKAVESDGLFTPVLMTGLTPEKLFSYFKKYFNEFRKNDIDLENLLAELDYLVCNNIQLHFCRRVLDSALYTTCSDKERLMFYFLCHRYVSNGEQSVDIDSLMCFVDYMEDEDAIRRRFTNGSMIIQDCGLVCFATEDGMADTDSLSLSDNVKEVFFRDVELAQPETAGHPDIIRTGSIKARELFFNDCEGAQIARLENLLEAENFKQVQKRLISSGMRKGFNAIFYGAPGTGKTASVYELARRSGRDIFQVDMSKLKSKWVGDSEKSVRGVFRMYRSLCRSSQKAPILLFNEADAIFTRRIENIEQSVDQMNNALQNIILEEMENIEGILIATTNLLANLDPAFERRFIFKVEFNLPEKEPRARIWQAMVPGLSREDAITLADRYSFSGGNIENIARKSTVEYVLSGNEPTLEALESYCEEEILNRKDKRQKIGF